MSKRDKRLHRWKNNPKDVRFEELIDFLTYYGFYVNNPSGGSHYVIGHPAVGQTTIVRGNPMKSIYVKRALAKFEELIETLKELEGDSSDEEE